MPVSKIKNIAILLLIAANLVLLTILLPGRSAQARDAEAMRRSLSSLYAAQEVALDPDNIPDTVTLYALELSEDTDADLAAATALLGEQVLVQDDSTRYLSTYHSELGSCSISRTGAFQVRLENQKPRQDLRKSAQNTLETMGFACHQLDGPVRLRAGVYTFTATQSVLDMPVFTDGLTLTFSNDSLIALDGTFFTGTGSLTRISDQACLSAADALVSFLSARFDLGWVGSEIISMEQGYVRSETASAAAVHLTPVWQLQTDTGNFYINGLSGEVTAI